MNATTPTAAIYGRVSHNNQRQASIEDQVNRCKSIADSKGFAVPDHLVFSDYAISGKGSETHRRDGYAELMAAWTARKFQVLLVDEQSRLFRDEDEAAHVKKLIKSTGVRVISADGLDTANQMWEFLWGIKSTMGVVELTQLAFRVKRGMHGALDRGYGVWKPPFGYDRKPEYASDGTHIGTRWDLNEEQAAIVRRIFNERKAGSSYNKIAAGLNADAVLAPSGRAWRASSVLSILLNRTYTGVIAFGGSRVTQHKVRTGQRAPVDNEGFRDEYLRPDMALVSTEVWEAVQPGVGQEVGENKHWAAGIVTCQCGGQMTAKFTASSQSWSVYCRSCVHDKQVGIAGADPVYIADHVLRQLLQEALKQSMTDEVVADFRGRLSARLAGSFAAELDEAKAQVARANRVMTKLASALVAVNDEEAEAVIHAEMASAAEIRRAASDKVKKLEANAKGADEAHIKAQLDADPRTVLEGLFDTTEGPLLREILSQVFPSIVFAGRAAAHTRESHFQVAVAPGMAAAVLTGTTAVDSAAVASRFRVQSSSRRAIPAQVHRVGENGQVIDSDKVEVKACTRCEETKHFSLFTLKPNGRPGSYCLVCSKAYQKEQAIKRRQQKEAQAA